MTDTIIQVLKIDPEFQTLIPPLTDDEYKRLETSLVSNGWEGWRGPILVWNGVIVDGHNRYRICQEHGIAYTTKKMHFSDRDAAKLFIIDNQLKRRNLPPAAIGDLKLEEKEIVARQAKERQGARTDIARENIPPNLGEGSHDGETLEILARDIPMGRESLRKLDVIKQKAKEGDPVAIEERRALISGEKKSIHGAYMRVTGEKKQRTVDESTDADGRRICAMCGEPINDGEANPARPTIHIRCEREYQRDWEREKRKPKTAEDGRRICSVCGKPIDDGDSYEYRPSMHKACFNKRTSEQRYANPDRSLLDNVPTYTISSLLAELTSSADNLRDAWAESVSINESMGVSLTKSQKKRLDRAVTNLFKTIQKVREETNNG